MKFVNRSFHLIDYSTTHNQFLFRSFGTDNNRNIDVLFEGVVYLQLPLKFKDCDIFSIKHIDEFESFIHFDSSKKVFIIIEEDSKHYIVANRVRYQENDLASNETSIPIEMEENMTTDDIHSIAKRITEEGIENFTQTTKMSNWIEIP